jgi:hypothetical protein
LNFGSALARENGSDAIVVTAKPVLRNPIKEEIYVLIACSPRLKKRYKLILGFTPEFIKSTLFSFLFSGFSISYSIKIKKFPFCGIISLRH